MSGKPRTVYWDCCIFLAWIKNEEVWPPSVMAGIAEMVDQFEGGNLVIVTSAITRLELLSAQLTDEHKRTIEGVFKNPNLQLVDVDGRRVTPRAVKIREFYDSRIWKADGSKTGRNMGYGDAIHLATAQHYQVNTFYTLDGSSCKNKNNFPLLKLDNPVAGEFMNICVPSPEDRESTEEKRQLPLLLEATKETLLPKPPVQLIAPDEMAEEHDSSEASG